MSDKEKMLTGAYYWLSMFKAGASGDIEFVIGRNYQLGGNDKNE